MNAVTQNMMKLRRDGWGRKAQSAVEVEDLLKNADFPHKLK